MHPPVPADLCRKPEAPGAGARAQPGVPRAHGGDGTLALCRGGSKGGGPEGSFGIDTGDQTPRVHLVPGEEWAIEVRMMRRRAAWEGPYQGRTETAEEEPLGSRTTARGQPLTWGGDVWGPPWAGRRCHSSGNAAPGEDGVGLGGSAPPRPRLPSKAHSMASPKPPCSVSSPPSLPEKSI